MNIYVEPKPVGLLKRVFVVPESVRHKKETNKKEKNYLFVLNTSGAVHRTGKL